jgi:Ribbon-helix-helix domain
MSPKRRYTFYITEELDAALKALKQRDGIPEAEALRRALAAYLEQQGVLGSPAARAAINERGEKGPRAMQSASRRARTHRKA